MIQAGFGGFANRETLWRNCLSALRFSRFPLGSSAAGISGRTSEVIRIRTPIDCQGVDCLVEGRMNEITNGTNRLDDSR